MPETVKLTWWQEVDMTSFLNLDDYTQARAVAGRDNGVNRQCSIGYHLECSDPGGYDCECPCHELVKTMMSMWQKTGQIP